MTILFIFLLFFLPTLSPPALVEKIDLYDPVTGAYTGNEINRYGPDGRRLRWELNDAEGKNALLFFVVHDVMGRESKAIYFEDGSKEPSREAFSYSENGSIKTTNYISRTGAPSDRTESDLDDNGRELQKRYFRANGTQYGAEDVLWNADGTKRGWDFKYVARKGGASFRYEYLSFDKEKNWIRRIKTRNGKPEQIEVRTLTTQSNKRVYMTPARFGSGIISTGQSETSPSFAKDGKTMVFARYGDDWSEKVPYIANLKNDGWKVKPIKGTGKIYNLAISPAGDTIIYVKRSEKNTQLFRIVKKEDDWSKPENLTKKYGIVGSYPVMTENGDLYFFDAAGALGSGIYMAPKNGPGFGKSKPVFVTKEETLFDPYTVDGKKIIVSRCFDDICNPGPKNGFWEITPDGKGSGSARKIPELPYAWGSQVVRSLGLFVYTDGENILAVPLADSGVE